MCRGRGKGCREGMHDAKAIQSYTNASLHSSSGSERLCLPCLLPGRISQEKQLFYAGTVPHVISEAKARCATAAAAREDGGGGAYGEL